MATARLTRTQPQTQPQLVATDDGRNVLIRPLRPADRGKYEAAVASLSPRSRYLRFGAPLPQLSERLVDQLMDLDGSRHVAYVALTPDGSAGLGVARYVRSAGDPGSAEVAIAIADEWQRSGLGRSLLERLLEHARLAGVVRLVGLTLRENLAAARVARAVGFSAATSAGLYVTYEKRL